MIEIFSTGGGTQSTAIAALIVQGRLPKPDLVVIADTGREMPTTWKYLDEVTRPALAGIGIVVHRIKASDWASQRGRGLFATSGQLMIPAFTNKSGSVSKLSAFCSGAWKSEAIDRCLSQVRGIKRSQYRKWIGFSLDEETRVRRMQNGEEYKRGLIRFPLVYDVPSKRNDAISIVVKMGWPLPPRSRCWMCPNQSDMEWREVQRDYPQRFEEAIAIDESIRERDPNAFLHSTATPLHIADISAEDDLFSASCPSGECFL